MQQSESTEKQQHMVLGSLAIDDPFWSYYIDLVRNVVVPYQWEALNDRISSAEPSGAVANFKIAAGLMEGEFYGMVFQDSDVAKWLEAVAYLLETHPDPELEQIADGMIDIIAMAQQDDGYVNTYYTLKEPGARWTNLAECHELYCAGHLIEAAVAYYRATGKRKLLDIAIRFADYIDSVFGNEAGKLRGYDGHQEIELALVKLYEVTHNERYLNLSAYFLNERGQKPNFFEQQLHERGGRTHFPELDMALDLEYNQNHLPVREQEKAVGHAVRMVYMLAGMADVAVRKNDRDMLDACKRLWDNIVSRQMYITGSIGSMVHGEAFSYDYDLPNDTVYAETCASIGLIFFAHRMLQITKDAQFADVMERALYNTVVAGMSRDGKHFFYVNPLEVNPKSCGGGNKNYNHVKPVRQKWFGCACCPPNIARLLSSLGGYVYSVTEGTIYHHLYIGGEAKLTVDGTSVTLNQQSSYPWHGDISIEVVPEESRTFALALRIPQWCGGKAEIRVSGERIAPEDWHIQHGYAHIKREWQQGDRVELSLDMPVMRVHSHPAVQANAGKVALQRGPLVYCLEEADNGEHLHQLILPKDGRLNAQEERDLLGGIVTIEADAVRLDEDEWDGELYSEQNQPGFHPVQAKFIPYYAWANRGEGEMSVWVREQQ